MNLDVVYTLISRIAFIAICLVALKALTIGSDFSFSYYFKYKKRYWKWYKNRHKFEEQFIYTCQYCNQMDTCKWAFDDYNMNGDCLAEKQDERNYRQTQGSNRRWKAVTF